MRKSYYIFVVAHSIRGRIRRIHIPHYFLHLVGLLALVGAVTMFGAAASYMRMLLKVARYDHLRKEINVLKLRYNALQNTMSEQKQQLASLQSLANEVSMAYGLKQVHKVSAPEDETEAPLAFRTSVEQYRMLIRASFAPPLLRQSFLDERWAAILPSLWPVQGPLTGTFGERLDPFNGEGSFHAGVDISTGYGAPVRAAADGVVLSAERSSGYGMMVEIEHGRGLQTRYAHLAGFTVVPGQAVKAGEIVGYVGRTGRSTGSHLHYEVRVHDTPVNPVKYLSASALGLSKQAGLGPWAAPETGESGSPHPPSLSAENDSLPH